MKRISFYFVLTATMFMTMATTCEDDDYLSVEVQPVINTLTSGTWRVTYFYDTDSEETNHFSGYNFSFGPGNVLTATNGTNTYTGNWSVTNSNSDDDSSSDIDVNIQFSSPANFEELSDDWDVVLHTADNIQLIDISGGNGGTDYLTFEKN